MSMIRGASYRHTNLIATDWRKLAGFYETVFGCTPVPPTRDLHGTWLERATAVPGAHLRGVHLRLPGHGPNGPTLEIFQYDEVEPQGVPSANRAGFAHLAFHVDDVDAAVEAVLREGGKRLGDTVDHEVPGAGMLRFAYVRDPEGNIVELQRWGQEPGHDHRTDQEPAQMRA